MRIRIAPIGHDGTVTDNPEIEPEAQVLPERKLISLVAPDPIPGDVPVPEPDADDAEGDDRDSASKR